MCRAAPSSWQSAKSADGELATTSGLATKSSGMLDIDRYDLTTSRDNVYAGGDYVAGASNVVTAMSYGKEAARSIDRHLTGEPRFETDLSHLSLRSGAAGTQPVRAPSRPLPAGCSARQDVRRGGLGATSGRGACGGKPLPALRHS